MNPTILITGATGTIGRFLVPYLHAHSEADLVLFLHQRGAELDRDPLLDQLYGLQPSSRVRIVRGDLTGLDLGLCPNVRTDLLRSVTHILHGAASTRFDLSYRDALRINTEGTRRMVVFAAECDNLQQFGYLSTAYVCGQRTGTIREDELHHEEDFANTYEASKYEAERFLHALRRIMPMAVYRLSTVFGDSRTGAVVNMTAPHHAMKIMYLGLASIMPGKPDYPVDLIPADYAAATVGRLFLDRFESGKTYHVTACPEKSCTLADLIELLYGTFAEIDPAWSKRRFPRPSLSSGEGFDLFVRSVEEAKNPFFSGMLRLVQHFARQLTYPKTFDRTNVKQALPHYDEEMPDVCTYCEKVVRYCLQTEWGKYAA